MVTTGKGVAIVQRIGEKTLLGQIGKSLSEVKTEKSPLEKETNRMVLIMSVVGAVCCLMLFLVVGLKDGDWWAGLGKGLTLAMALLPEEFPVVLTVFLNMGAWRLSAENVSGTYGW